MKYRSYNFETKIATGLFANLFNDIEIVRYDGKRQSDGTTIKVPVVIATRNRALKELENPNKTLKVPLISIAKESYERDSQRMTELYEHLTDIPEGYTRHNKMRGIPINITFTVAAIARYDSDLDQIMQNFIPFFKPDVFVSWKHPHNKEMEIKSQVVWNGNINYQSPVEVTTNQNEIYQFETEFVFKTYFFAGNADDSSGYDDGPLIKTVNVTGNEFFNVGDEGYDMHRVFVVPKSVSLSDFKRMANEGKVDEANSDIVCYPRVVANNVYSDQMFCYPLTTNITAATLKMTLLDEDEDFAQTASADNSYYAFGFDANSQVYDVVGWHFKTDIDYDEERHNYSAISNWQDSEIEIGISSIFNANFDWMSPNAQDIRISTPTSLENIAEEWLIRASCSKNIGHLFIDDEIEWNCDGSKTLIWSNRSSKPLKIGKYAITASADAQKAPLSWSLEGRTVKNVWIKLDQQVIDSWNPNETKYFDIDKNELDFLSFKIIFGDSSFGDSISIKRLRCWPNIYQESTEFSKNVYESSFKIDIRKPGDNDFFIDLSKILSQINGESDRQVSADFGTAIEEINYGEFELSPPSLGGLQPVFFRPMNYLIFKYKKRKYGLSVGGFIKVPYAQSITYGNFFPSRVANGSLHVLTNVDGTPMYQYDAESVTWFEVGNPTRSLIQKTNVALINSDNKIYQLDRGSSASFSFNVYQSDVDQQYLNLNIRGDHQGRAVLTLNSDAVHFVSQPFRMIATTDGIDVHIPFTMMGEATYLSLSLSELESDVNSIIISDWSISKKLIEGDQLEL